MSKKSEQPYPPLHNLNALFEPRRHRESSAEQQQSPQQKLALKAIHLNTDQPRRYFDPEKMEQLIASVQKYGILENLLVRAIPQKPGEYELIAGERRYRAAQRAGLTEVPVHILEVSDQEALQIALVENLQREDLNPVEETEGILQLLAIHLEMPVQEAVSFLYRMDNESPRNFTHNVVGKQKKTVEEVFNTLGRMSWQSFVKHRLPLLKLPAEVLEALQQGQIAYTKAQAIAQVKDEEQRQELLQMAIAENLSIREIRDRIKQLSQSAKTPSPSVEYFKRFNSVGRQLKKTSAWEDQEKRDRLERLLREIEELIN